MRFTGNILESVKGLYALPNFMSGKSDESSASNHLSKDK
jgi:hypothetical protein